MASLFQCHFSLKILSLYDACPPREGAPSSPAAYAQGLLVSRCTHSDASRWQGCDQVSPVAQDGTAKLEATASGKTTPWTSPSCFALCWNSPNGLSLALEQ